LPAGTLFAKEGQGDTAIGLQRMTAIQRWFATLAGIAAAAAVAFQWLDRPISTFAHVHFQQHREFETLTHIPDPFIPAAIVIFVAVGIYVLAGRGLAKPCSTALLCALSAIVAEAAKSQLKYIFGRTWPDTWVQNNPSFIHDNVYGFNFFHGGAGYASFPSGHMSLTGAVISVLWIAYPKFRPLYAMIALAVVVGLLGANYHFLSDVIAGGFVGVSTSWMMTAMWQARQTATPVKT
jgi:membrane-associated phospholipid phosphatase